MNFWQLILGIYIVVTGLTKFIDMPASAWNAWLITICGVVIIVCCLVGYFLKDSNE